MPHPLDRPIWSALATRQAGFDGEGQQVRRYPHAVSPFIASADTSAGLVADLAARIAPGDDVSMLEIDPPPAPPGLEATRTPIHQMTASTLRGASPVVAWEPLDDADAPEMLALATLTRPGPFRERTHEMGRFIGVREQGRLIAMCGERLNLDGFHEASALCTHPAHRGRGLGGALLRAVCERILAEGDQVFLHCYVTNTTAREMYERMGFTVRADLVHAIWKRPV